MHYCVIQIYTAVGTRENYGVVESRGQANSKGIDQQQGKSLTHTTSPQHRHVHVHIQIHALTQIAHKCTHIPYVDTNIYTKQCFTTHDGH